jgi:hypothetical protein
MAVTILSYNVYKENTDDYSKLRWIYCIHNVLNYDALWLVLYYYHFLSKYHCFLQCTIILFLKVLQNPAYKSLQSTEISLYVAFTNEWNVAKKETILMNDSIYLEI